MLGKPLGNGEPDGVRRQHQRQVFAKGVMDRVYQRVGLLVPAIIDDLQALCGMEVKSTASKAVALITGCKPCSG